MRKRLALAVTLFQEAGKCLETMPSLLLQPIWPYLSNMAVIVYAVALFVFLHSLCELLRLLLLTLSLLLVAYFLRIRGKEISFLTPLFFVFLRLLPASTVILHITCRSSTCPRLFTVAAAAAAINLGQHVAGSRRHLYDLQCAFTSR